MLNYLVDSGLIVLLALAFLTIETVLILAWKRSGIRPFAAWMNAGAGACLLLALGASLAGLEAGWIAGLLFLSLVFHLADLRNRRRGGPAR